MRLERLVIDSGDRTLAAEFHPRLTVIGGLEPAAREALAGEIVDSLAGARPGVHLELLAGGRSLTVFRPTTGRHRVVDTDAVQDVTGAHVDDDGEIDLFAAAGVDRASARRTIRFARDDLVLRQESDAWIARLAGADQPRLWDTATRCRAAEVLLEQASAAGGVSTDDAPIVEEVEERHAALAAATDSYERVRLIALTIATVGTLGAVGMANLEGRSGVAPFVLVAVLGALLGLRYRRMVDVAARAERDVLRRAGADDYSAFHFERVSALLDTDHERRRFVQAVGDHRRAMAAWESLAGPVPLPFAIEHESEVRAAAGLHAGMGALQVLSSTSPVVGADVAAELAQGVLARLEAVRALTGDGERLPLVVDDPFEGLDPSMKPMLLEMLAARAGDPQVIVLTADEDVVSWARLEAMTGEVGVIEPTIRTGAMAEPVG